MFGSDTPGPPQRGDDRYLRTPRPVWVDLATLYPITGSTRPFQDGWDLQAEVPGELHAWMRTTTGAWIAMVRYRVRRGTGEEGVMHTGWLPAWSVRPRGDAPDRR